MCQSGPMKTIIFSLLLATFPLTTFAESVTCVSNEGDWVVTLDLDSLVGSNIKFMQNEVVAAKFGETEVNSYRFPRRIMNYELELTSGKYLYIYRDMKGKVPLKSGSAVFYLANHPFALEKHAENCTFSE